MPPLPPTTHQPFWPDDIAGQIADVVSFVGFTITIYVAVTARNIRRDVQRHARLPEILVTLEKIAAEFTVFLQPNHDATDRMKLLGQAEGVLNSLMGYSDKKGQGSIAIVTAKVSACKVENPSTQHMRDMYSNLYRLVEELRDQVRKG